MSPYGRPVLRGLTRNTSATTTHSHRETTPTFVQQHGRPLPKNQKGDRRMFAKIFSPKQNPEKQLKKESHIRLVALINLPFLSSPQNTNKHAVNIRHLRWLSTTTAFVWGAGGCSKAQAVPHHLRGALATVAQRELNSAQPQPPPSPEMPQRQALRLDTQQAPPFPHNKRTVVVLVRCIPRHTHPVDDLLPATAVSSALRTEEGREHT